jgi:uncharacterized protein YdhG (YjbR/CyaY superfamily)
MKDVNMYISDFTPDIQEILTRIRKLIKDTAPGAVEGMAYGMPAYRVQENEIRTGK